MQPSSGKTLSIWSATAEIPLRPRLKEGSRYDAQGKVILGPANADLLPATED
jgi:hypothetical protein